jgi:hypothetical protein
VTFDEFKAAYIDTFNRMMEYSPSQVGAGVYAEKMAALADAHPDWAERVEETA